MHDQLRLHHPLTAASLFFALIGNVISGPISEFSAHLASPARFVVVGLALFAGSIFVLVQSWRHRASSEGLPLPALLIVFGLLFDLTIAVGRSGSGSGVAEAVSFNRYLMANLILLTGIVIYVLAHLPRVAPRPARVSSWRTSVTFVTLAVVMLFVVVQVTEATRFGMTNGRATRKERIVQAQFLVNSDPDSSCRQFDSFLWGARKTTLLDTGEDHLGEFTPSLYRYYRGLGPPSITPLIDAVCFPAATTTAR